jgi:hypothetical protein
LGDGAAGHGGERRTAGIQSISPFAGEGNRIRNFRNVSQVFPDAGEAGRVMDAELKAWMEKVLPILQSQADLLQTTAKELKSQMKQGKRAPFCPAPTITARTPVTKLVRGEARDGVRLAL